MAAIQLPMMYLKVNYRDIKKLWSSKTHTVPVGDSCILATENCGVLNEVCIMRHDD